MTTLLYSLDDYKILTVKKLKIYKEYDHGTINKLRYSLHLQIFVALTFL
jgi:hypothetical protein